MTGRALPAFDGVAGELSRLEAAAVEVEGQVLRDRAIAIALRLGALGGLAAVRLVGELAALAEVVGKGPRGRRQRRVGLQGAELVLLAERVRHLDDGDLGLRQVGEHGHELNWRIAGIDGLTGAVTDMKDDDLIAAKRVEDQIGVAANRHDADGRALFQSAPAPGKRCNRVYSLSNAAVDERAPLGLRSTKYSANARGRWWRASCIAPSLAEARKSGLNLGLGR